MAMLEKALRQKMVAEQLEARDVRDERVLEAMRRTPRHLFVPERLEDEAYEDRPLPIGGGQTISQPLIVAIMTELLRLKGDERILEVGTGSGYQAALLAELGAQVVTVERRPEMAARAKELLEHLGYSNIRVIVGDGNRGAPEYAPFDAILVTAGAPTVSAALFEQLAPGGRLVAPVGDRDSQRLVRWTKVAGKRPKEEDFGGCLFVPLVGAGGWTGEGSWEGEAPAEPPGR
jgi:protein-L-isoaspartate(D-aspartate) O-methyltransferase